MNFCSKCGARLSVRVPQGDNLPRHVCSACHMIHYQNPKVVVGCIPVWGEKVLMCRRAIEPRYGLWTLPAGFMENSETTSQAAVRETWEEAQARVEIHAFFSLFNLPHINQVYVIYRGQLRDANFAPGEESLEVCLFDEAQIPWDAIAFPVIEQTLRLYYRDRARGDFGTHAGDIIRTPDHGYTIDMA